MAERWQDLATHWEGHADGKSLVFADMHAAMAELGSGQEALVERRLDAMRETAASTMRRRRLSRGRHSAGRGPVAFHRGAYEEAVALLLPVRFDLWRIGGSHAQRDVVDWTLTEAAVRGGMRDVALALANERLGARPRSVVNRQFLRRAEQIAA